MSMTQQIVDELREVADALFAEARKARREDRKAKFTSWAIRVQVCADDLGDD